MTATYLADLRAELFRQDLDGLIVPRADEHLGEYVPANAERLLWLTGFSGSAGLAIVLRDRAVVFTDGRYSLQLATQTDPDLWERAHSVENPPATWLAAHAKAARIGYDPMLMSEESLQKYVDAGLTLIPVTRNPIDAVWRDRPPAPLAPALPHLAAGRTSADKRVDIADILRAAGQDVAVITDPASVAWLLNIRGGDVPFTPFALGFALIHADAHCDLFMQPEKLQAATRDWLGNAVAVHDRAALPAAIAALRHKKIRVDSMGTPAWFAQSLRAAGAVVVAGADPCLLPKAQKNAAEQAGARNAHARDAVAVCRFLHWLETAAGRETELSAAAQLVRFRSELKDFQGESFPAISGAGEHGAIIHYRVSPETDRAIRPRETYLIDSGAQFSDGTTDVTRTIWTGGTPQAALKDRFTRVLKGHIALARLCFPQGVAGPHIDAIARVALWEVGLDYDHGTGHGVGSYLSVHEGPVSLSRAARPVPIGVGMILSNEPGYYAPGEYGIRLENLLLVQPAELSQARKQFLRFETLTLAPFDLRLLDHGQLTRTEVAWIDAYHARVLREVGPNLPPDVRAWLGRACQSLTG